MLGTILYKNIATKPPQCLKFNFKYDSPCFPLLQRMLPTAGDGNLLNVVLVVELYLYDYDGDTLASHYKSQVSNILQN